ncbi:MAG: hypothetical protein OXU50_00730 [Gammaproteobacteria bacterium]|nr:hypothetical protein [Gammaproteobacteria bacterium]
MKKTNSGNPVRSLPKHAIDNRANQKNPEHKDFGKGQTPEPAEPKGK